MAIEDNDERRKETRRGAEHVQIKGTTEELGQIVPPPVEVQRSGRDDEDDDDPEP
jgi:hypothetical protein